jgi:hypothetical protein
VFSDWAFPLGDLGTNVGCMGSGPGAPIGTLKSIEKQSGLSLKLRAVNINIGRRRIDSQRPT